MKEEIIIVNGITIKLFDQPHTFLVQSEKRPNIWYGVDLIENRHLGSCTCPWFVGKLFPEYRIIDGLTKKKARFRCKHIQACRELVMDDMILPKLEEIERDRAAF